MQLIKILESVLKSAFFKHKILFLLFFLRYVALKITVETKLQ